MGKMMRNIQDEAMRMGRKRVKRKRRASIMRRRRRAQSRPTRSPRQEQAKRKHSPNP